MGESLAPGLEGADAFVVDGWLEGFYIECAVGLEIATFDVMHVFETLAVDHFDQFFVRERLAPLLQPDTKLPLTAKLALTMQTAQTACYPLAGLSALGSLVLLAVSDGDAAQPVAASSVRRVRPKRDIVAPEALSERDSVSKPEHTRYLAGSKAAAPGPCSRLQRRRPRQPQHRLRRLPILARRHNCCSSLHGTRD